MKTLLDVVPTSSPVRLGDQQFWASEYRLRDIAALQWWVNQTCPDLFHREEVRVVYGPRDHEWKQILWNIAAEPDNFDEVLATEAGVVQQLWTACHRASGCSVEQITQAIAVGRKYPLVVASQIDRILRLAWGQRPQDLIRFWVDGPTPVGEPTDWARVYAEYITTVPGGPEFGDLTLGQYRAWRTGGKSPDMNRPDAVKIAVGRAQFWKGCDGE